MNRRVRIKQIVVYSGEVAAGTFEHELFEIEIPEHVDPEIVKVRLGSFIFDSFSDAQEENG